MSTTLYRFFDAAGQLLYVGISDRPFQRLQEHRDKPWWSEITSSALEHFADRLDALAAEDEAIRRERPRYNVQGNGRNGKRLTTNPLVTEHDQVREGVSDAWDFWLSQHDISTPENIHSAIREAFERWLEEHSEELIAALAERHRRFAPMSEAPF